MPLRSIRRKFLGALLAATVFFALAMVVFAQTFLRGELVELLGEKGVAIARKVASDAVNPVITERYFEVRMMFGELQESEKDVVYAFVVGEDGRDLAHTFAGGIPAELKKANPVGPLELHSLRELLTDKGPVLDIAVPLLGGEIGVLHLGLSLAPIRRDVNNIVLLIVAFAVTALLSGAAAAVAFSRVITRPLVSLAAAAEDFGRGVSSRGVTVDTRDEVGDLARVFNTMIENRSRFEEEREQLIEELRKSLSEVKTLRGFLPICSSCKKIRDDRGYWQQIESYLTEHSGTEFSHGLCPECMKRLYPEIVERMQQKTQAAGTQPSER